MLEHQPYHLIREHMRPGDIIAFGGNSLFSRWTKFTTGSVVTHIAVVLHTNIPDKCSGRYVNQIMEATIYNGKQGVMTNRLSERINNYNGDMWWLPLGEQARYQFNQNHHAFFNFMNEQHGKPYDIFQLFGSAVDTFDGHPLLNSISYNEENFTRWFCSELVAEGLKTAKVIKDINASEVTPIDICRFSIFKGRYVQVKGTSQVIEGYNSLSTERWGKLDFSPHSLIGS